ncbi:alpha/beta fold hydrolase [Defluviimonas sp. WL0050]|uniref:Alpha/beta fold hydrolase n=1 Tax=Albidovulum litorale TaxID=2984134 RepID=A0ABT2ZMY7_9RHOB|nr:alpha/beta fold hydrolase [Defluviimonas sp. WL0050]MCV2872495.1 alpha/beta fold hydrolase [Defluviimonas sp. WL0050]
MAGGTAYDLTGPADAPVLVLIHGLGLSRATWADVAPVLARDYRVLTYDLCGHGESALPEQIPSLTVLSDQLRDLMDALSIRRATLIGFSLGGMINRRFAMDHPDRCDALIILNSPHERSPEAQRLVEERAAATGAGGPAATITETLKRWFTPGFRESNTKTVDWVRETVLANHPDNYTRHRQVLASGVVELVRPAPPIPHPSLVMTCENDTGSTPAMSHGIAAEIPGAETIIVPRLQHLGLLEEPQLFLNPILRFLGRIHGKD